MRVPVKIIVDGMILIAIIFAAESKIQCRDAGKILKCGIVGSVSQSFDVQIVLLANGAALRRRFLRCDGRQMGRCRTDMCVSGSWTSRPRR